MANHNAAYLYEIDGITIWERLRAVRNFLSLNQESLALAELDMKRKESQYALLEDTLENRFKIQEFEITKPALIRAINRCRDEVAFLTKLEGELAVFAEATRVPGKTDEEMYEINYYNEVIARNVRKAHCDFIAHGVLTPNTLDSLLRCPPAIKVLSDQNILNFEGIHNLIESGKLKEIGYAEIPANI